MKINEPIPQSEIDRLEAIPEPELKLPQPNVEYLEDRTDGWNWFGEFRWWEIFIVWDGGFAGGTLPSCRRLWRWNGSNETLRTDYVNVEPPRLLAAANPATQPTTTPAEEGAK